MPTFFSRSTHVRLSIIKPHQTSSTRQIGWDNTLIGEAATDASHDVLSEEALISTEDPDTLRFLGPNRDIPFFLVRAGKELYHRDVGRKGGGRGSGLSDTLRQSLTAALSTIPLPDDDETARTDGTKELGPKPEKSSRSAGGLLKTALHNAAATPQRLLTPNPSPVRPSTGRNETSSLLRRLSQSSPPQALLAPRSLCLTVSLSKSSFTPLPAYPVRQEPLDIQICVFFNGEFTASRVVHHRTVKGVAYQEDLIQTFTGRRVERVLERKWVLVPTGQDPDGSLRQLKRSKGAYPGAGERWGQIAAALQTEADEWGWNKAGQRSALGAYLCSLTKLGMPPDVDKMQKGGTQKFGVVDVVIALGRGNKDWSHSHYLKEPKRHLDPRYRQTTAVSKENEQKSLPITLEKDLEELHEMPPNFARPTFASTQKSHMAVPRPRRPMSNINSRDYRAGQRRQSSRRPLLSKPKTIHLTNDFSGPPNRSDTASLSSDHGMAPSDGGLARKLPLIPEGSARDVTGLPSTEKTTGVTADDPTFKDSSLEPHSKRTRGPRLTLTQPRKPDEPSINAASVKGPVENLKRGRTSSSPLSELPNPKRRRTTPISTATTDVPILPQPGRSTFVQSMTPATTPAPQSTKATACVPQPWHPALLNSDSLITYSEVRDALALAKPQSFPTASPATISSVVNTINSSSMLVGRPASQLASPPPPISTPSGFISTASLRPKTIEQHKEPNSQTRSKTSVPTTQKSGAGGKAKADPPKQPQRKTPKAEETIVQTVELKGRPQTKAHEEPQPRLCKAKETPNATAVDGDEVHGPCKAERSGTFAAVGVVVGVRFVVG
ncbi:MAG: hypothetical protein M1817_000225 [Caeruleum heppii]|nr:MAG: hypothetical protein M1817_000225 [Caeruleum heppii]